MLDLLHKIVSALFAVSWAACIGAAIYAATRAFAAIRRSALPIAIAVAVAYVAGVISPFSFPNSGGSAPADQPAPAPPAAAPPAPASTPIQIDTVCRAGAKASPSQQALGHIDQAGPAQREGFLHLAGWATYDAQPGTAACVTIDGVVVETHGAFHGTRVDVEAAFRQPSMRDSGFDLTFRGRHGHVVIGVAVRDAGGAYHIMPDQRTVDL